MSDLISRDEAISLIERFQRELCPVGMYSRHAVYGSDREKYDNWQFIIDELEKIPQVKESAENHGMWIPDGKKWICSNCKETNYYAYVWQHDDNYLHLQDKYCPNCGCLMDESEAFYSEDGIIGQEVGGGSDE